MSLAKLSLAGNNLPNPSPWKVGKKKQESWNFFYSVHAKREARPGINYTVKRMSKSHSHVRLCTGCKSQYSSWLITLLIQLKLVFFINIVELAQAKNLQCFIDRTIELADKLY